MTDAPEKIIARSGRYYDYVTDWSEGEWYPYEENDGQPDEKFVLYVRADLTPVVKPLEWEDQHGWLVALTPLGRLEVYQGASGFWRYSLNGRSHGQFFTRDEAKAAAQADYEKRILSALTFTPSDKDAEIERLREALADIADAFGCECGDQARAALEERG